MCFVNHQNILYAGEIVILVTLMLLMFVISLKKMYHPDKLHMFIAKLAGDAAQPLLYATWSPTQSKTQKFVGFLFSCNNSKVVF